MNMILKTHPNGCLQTITGKTSLIYSQIQNKYEVLRFLIDYLKYQHLLLILKRDTLLMTKVVGGVKYNNFK